MSEWVSFCSPISLLIIFTFVLISFHQLPVEASTRKSRWTIVSFLGVWEISGNRSTKMLSKQFFYLFKIVNLMTNIIWNYGESLDNFVLFDAKSRTKPKTCIIVDFRRKKKTLKEANVRNKNEHAMPIYCYAIDDWTRLLATL